MTLAKLLLTFFLLSLTACSSLKVVYSRLDWIIPYTVDDYVSLTQPQQDALEKELRILLDWHCKKPVNQYAKLLRNIRADVKNDNVNNEIIGAYMQELTTYWQDVAEKIALRSEKVMIDINQTQIDELFQNLGEKNLNYQRDYVDIPYSELRLKLIEGMKDRYENWLGELSEKQLAAINRWSYGATKRTAGWVGSRLVWQQALRDILGQQADQKRFSESLFVLLRYPEKLWTESYKMERESGQREIKKLLYLTYQSLLPRQREHLMEKLGSWGDDIESLSCIASAPELKALSRVTIKY